LNVVRCFFLVLFALPACATTWPGDPEIGGLALEIQLPQGNADWPLHADLKPRILRTTEIAADYWGLPLAAVSGWRLVLTEGLLKCGSNTMANGCTTDEDHSITLSANYCICIESSALLHEIGHVAIGDPPHSDPRWHDRERMGQRWKEAHEGLSDCGGEPYYGQWEGHR
jgi:hypothetical protein